MPRRGEGNTVAHSHACMHARTHAQKQERQGGGTGTRKQRDEKKTENPFLRCYCSLGFSACSVLNRNMPLVLFLSFFVQAVAHKPPSAAAGAPRSP